MNQDFDPFADNRPPLRGNRNTTTGKPKPSKFSSKTAFLGVMIALGVLIGAIFSLYPDSNSYSASQNLPIVRAESKPLKVIPDDAGGMEIPNRDSTVFSALRPDDEEERPRIENLLADSEEEEPLPRSQLFAGLNTEAEEAAQQIEQAEQVEIKRPERVVPFEAEENAERSQQELIEEAKDVLRQAEETREQQRQKESIIPPKPPPKVTTKPAVPQKASTKPKELTDVVDTVLGNESSAQNDPIPSSPSGTHYVQLASVKTRLEAESEWKKLRRAYNLNSQYRIKQVEIQDRGTFYRIQAGPYSKENATKICMNIKKTNPNGCLLAQ
ncbi:MAG: SPOR domain-containing protein [Pseudomonadota bacterium]